MKPEHALRLRQESKGGCGAERGPAAKTPQEPVGLGQNWKRLCSKGATWVGTETASNGNKVQAPRPHRIAAGIRVCCLVIHLQAARLWVRLCVRGLGSLISLSTLSTWGVTIVLDQDGDSDIPRSLWKAVLLRIKLTFAEFHGSYPQVVSPPPLP